MLVKEGKTSDNSWSVDIKEIDQETWDLSVHNPNREEETDTRPPPSIIKEIQLLEKQTAEALQKLRSYYDRRHTLEATL